MSDVVDEANDKADRERQASSQRAIAALGRQGSEFCEDCGVEIPRRRREALPSAKRCVDCQDDFEGGA